MAKKDDEDDVQDAPDATELQPAPNGGVYGTSRSAAPTEAADPSQYSNNDKLGMAAVALLTPLLGGLIGGKSGALAGASSGAEGVSGQIKRDEDFQRQQALYGQRYGRQNKLGYEVRRQMVDGVPTDVVFDRVTGQWKTPDGHVAYTSEGEKNAVPGAPAPAPVPADGQVDSTTPQSAAPAQAAKPVPAQPPPTDPVSKRLAELDEMMPADEDLDPAHRDGESITQAKARVQQAQAMRAHVLAEQGKLKDTVALGKGPKKAAASGGGAAEEPGPAASSKASYDPKLEKDWTHLNEKLTTALASGRSDVGRNQAVVTNAKKIMALGEQGQGQEGGLDKRQIHELAISVGNLLSGGTAAAQSTVESLVPRTVGSDTAKIEEWLTSDPTGTNQKEFVARMMETADRERHLAEEGIKSAKQDILYNSGLRNQDPARFQKVIEHSLGPNAQIDSQGRYVQQPYAPKTRIQPGHQESGYEFKGGDPGNKANWKKIGD